LIRATLPAVGQSEIMWRLTDQWVSNTHDFFHGTAPKRLANHILLREDLPLPNELAQEIADDLQTAWEQLASIAEKAKG
jgi:hypothetical protein